MPPSGKLPGAKIAALTKWIENGAPWPDYKSAAKTAEPLWSVKPIRTSVIPRVRSRTWIRSPIDAFVLSKLESKNLTPAPAAGRRELMRRAYFDLIGLPPSPEEVAAYMADTKPVAYERLIDRLLASPRYGERWARYWLDLVRYADTNGYERDNEKPYSWKYRDYVIKSFNDDKPFDRFVTEQLAGDEMPDRSEETVTGTGFLRLGTWDDEPNDPVAYKYDRLEDLVHATSAAFLGLTVRCARCHDHKFDPIPQKDYYALAAAFYGGYLDPGDGKFMGGPPPEKLGFPVLGFTESGREVPAIHLLQAGDPKKVGPEVRPAFLSVINGPKAEVDLPPADAKTTHRRLQLAAWITDKRNPLTARVIVNRIWQHHFGQGLVRTPNNFGSKGSPPTHPELLDWLANYFTGSAGISRELEAVPLLKTLEYRSDGKSTTPSFQHSTTPTRAWTFKRLHRLIMLSCTYRMASVHPNEAAFSQKDFLNEWLWKFNRRRLDADALRDSILTVSGQMNLRMGGPGFTPTVTKQALEGLSKKGAEWIPSPPDEQRRRSIYMFLKRALLLPLMTTFDFADTTAPLEQRDVTTVAPQALALMNNPWIHEQAEAFAARAEAEASGDSGMKIERAWRLAFGRSPSAKEKQSALVHINRFGNTSQDSFQRGLVSLCHVLLCSNEFAYVD